MKMKVIHVVFLSWLLGLSFLVAEEENSIGMTLIRIEPGEYLRGAADQNLIGKMHPFSTLARNRNLGMSPAHPVRISQAFWIGEREVTVGQFRAFVEATKHVTTAESTGKGALALIPAEQSGLKQFQTRPDCNWRNPGFAPNRRSSSRLRELARCGRVLYLAEQKGKPRISPPD